MLPRRMTDHLTAAIVVHECWRDDLPFLLAQDRAGARRAALADDRACALGAWLNGPEITPATRATPAWRVVARLHREYHETLGEVARLIDEGRPAAAKAHVVSASMARSNRLIAALQKWCAELEMARRPPDA